jgi:hypothetical protein
MTDNTTTKKYKSWGGGLLCFKTLIQCNANVTRIHLDNDIMSIYNNQCYIDCNPYINEEKGITDGFIPVIASKQTITYSNFHIFYKNNRFYVQCKNTKYNDFGNWFTGHYKYIDFDENMNILIYNFSCDMYYTENVDIITSSNKKNLTDNLTGYSNFLLYLKDNIDDDTYVCDLDNKETEYKNKHRKLQEILYHCITEKVYENTKDDAYAVYNLIIFFLNKNMNPITHRLQDNTFLYKKNTSDTSYTTGSVNVYNTLDLTETYNYLTSSLGRIDTKSIIITEEQLFEIIKEKYNNIIKNNETYNNIIQLKTNYKNLLLDIKNLKRKILLNKKFIQNNQKCIDYNHQTVIKI